jgi:hypothetical protein
MMDIIMKSLLPENPHETVKAYLSNGDQFEVVRIMSRSLYCLVLPNFPISMQTMTSKPKRMDS